MEILRSIQKSSLWRFGVKERRAVLLFGDTFVAIASVIFSLYYWAVSEKFLGFTLLFIQKRVPLWFLFFPLFWMILLIELYDVHRAGDWGATVRGIASAALVGFGLYLLLFFYYASPPRSLLPRRGVASFLILVSIATLLWRWVYIRVFTTPLLMRRVILVGGGNAGCELIKVVTGMNTRPFIIVGIVDDDPEKAGTIIEGFPVLGKSDTLNQIIQENGISDIIVAITSELDSGMFQALLDAQEKGIEITRMPIVYEELLGRVPIRLLEANWILRSFVDEIHVSTFYELAKRLIDIIGGLVGVSLFLFFLPFIALVILLDDGWPLFYKQERSGKNRLSYNIIKFRTMRRDAEADGHPRWAKEDDQRTTRVGKVLRKMHLDELPQFLNVVRGEMSLVGPRAERPELVNHFEERVPFYRARLLVKPGITGWAQINFGYAATIEETTFKLEYDLYYIKRRNLIMDIIILLRTPATVFGFRGR